MKPRWKIKKLIHDLGGPMQVYHGVAQFFPPEQQPSYSGIRTWIHRDSISSENLAALLLYAKSQKPKFNPFDYLELPI